MGVFPVVDLEARHSREAAHYDSAYSRRFSDAELLVTADGIPTFNCGVEVIVERLLDLMGPYAGKRVLEVGCGGGMFSTFLALRGARVMGIDLSEAALKVARRRASVSIVAEGSRPQFRVLSAEAMAEAFGPASWDVVFGFAVAHHFDQLLFPRQVGQVLAPGGALVLYEPTPHSGLLQRLREFPPISWLFPIIKDTPDEDYLHRSTITQLAHVLDVREYPCRTLLLALGERLVLRYPAVAALVNRLLQAVPVDARWPTGGCAAAHRLNVLDSLALERLPFLRVLCRTSIIVGRKRPLA